jgi:drug/metabolite transporter (DMT)-like permease
MWFIFAFASAIFDTLIDFIGTKNLKNTNFLPYTITWGITFFGGLFLLPFVLWLGFPTINSNTFWVSLFLGAIFNVIAYGNYYTSLKNADLSLIAPLTCLTPVFLLFTSPLLLLIFHYKLLNELPTFKGIIGVVLIFLGSYVLNIEQIQTDYFKPIKYIFYNPDLRKSVLAAFLWSITMALSKVALLSITGNNDFQKTLFWGCILLLTISIFLIPLIFQEIKKVEHLPKLQNLLILVGLGLINACIMFSQMVALSLTVTAYAIAVKRLSNIFKVILGNIILKESHFTQRIVASLIMISGVVLLTITNLFPNINFQFWTHVF